MGRSSSLQRQGSMPSCLVGSRWPQGLMLGPEPFDSCNSNVSDVTGNTLSRSEGSVKHTERAGTASSRGLPQETWKNSSSTPTKSSGRSTAGARWAQSCWEGAVVLLDARLNWLTVHIFTESKLDSGQKRKEKSLSPMLNSSGIPVLGAKLAKKIINTTSLQGQSALSWSALNFNCHSFLSSLNVIVTLTVHNTTLGHRKTFYKIVFALMRMLFCTAAQNYSTCAVTQYKMSLVYLLSTLFSTNNMKLPL